MSKKRDINSKVSYVAGMRSLARHRRELGVLAWTLRNTMMSNVKRGKDSNHNMAELACKAALAASIQAEIAEALLGFVHWDEAKRAVATRKKVK